MSVINELYFVFISCSHQNSCETLKILGKIIGELGDIEEKNIDPNFKSNTLMMLKKSQKKEKRTKEMVIMERRKEKEKDEKKMMLNTEEKMYDEFNL